MCHILCKKTSKESTKRDVDKAREIYSNFDLKFKVT